MMKTASLKQTKKFMEYVSQLAPEEFLGLAKVLCVQLVNVETKEPRDFYEILGEIIEKFVKLGKNQRKEVMSVVKAATRGGDNNGNASIDSETTK